jgi:ribosomal protein S18 acetylase RimI-like enzyme
MRLRPTHPGDEPFLRALYHEIVAPTFPAGAFAEPLRGALVEGQYAARRAGHTGAEQLIIEAGAGGAAVGHLVLREAPAELRVVELAIAEAHRGRGVGTAVLAHVIGRASAQGRSTLLSVARENAGALALYARLGFEPEPGGEDDPVTVRLRRRP